MAKQGKYWVVQDWKALLEALNNKKDHYAQFEMKFYLHEQGCYSSLA